MLVYLCVANLQLSYFNHLSQVDIVNRGFGHCYWFFIKLKWTERWRDYRFVLGKCSVGLFPKCVAQTFVEFFCTLVAFIFRHMAVWWRACPQNSKVLMGTLMLHHGCTGQPELIPTIPAGPSQTCFSSWESSSIFDGSHVKLHRTAHTRQEVPARITNRVCQFSE